MSPFGGVDARAVSTVLDVTLCLLLVSASVLTLAGTPVGREQSAAQTTDTADETAETLATSTARATYRAEERNRTARNRTIHDTLAGLLVNAVRADSRPDARPNATNPTPAFVEAVTETVGRALRRAEVGVQVVARPVGENGPQEDDIVAGETPPSDADVHAAAFAIRRVRLTVRTWDR